jgi:hypothetical protein
VASVYRQSRKRWGFRDNIRALGIEVVADRVVWEGNHVSGGGVSAGIDGARCTRKRWWCSRMALPCFA